jgi:hypothetical protein
MPPNTKQHLIGSDAATAGILALLVDQRECRVRDDRDAEKTEVVLSNAGLGYDDIAVAMGKKPDAVRKVIERNAKAGKKRN